MKPPYVDVKTAVRHFTMRTGIPMTVERFYWLIDAGVVPSQAVLRIGRRIYILLDAIDAWIDAGGGGFPEGGWRITACGDGQQA